MHLDMSEQLQPVSWGTLFVGVIGAGLVMAVLGAGTAWLYNQLLGS